MAVFLVIHHWAAVLHCCQVMVATDNTMVIADLSDLRIVGSPHSGHVHHNPQLLAQFMFPIDSPLMAVSTVVSRSDSVVYRPPTVSAVLSGPADLAARSYLRQEAIPFASMGLSCSTSKYQGFQRSTLGPTHSNSNSLFPTFAF